MVDMSLWMIPIVRTTNMQYCIGRECLAAKPHTQLHICLEKNILSGGDTVSVPEPSLREEARNRLLEKSRPH